MTVLVYGTLKYDEDAFVILTKEKVENLARVHKGIGERRPWAEIKALVDDEDREWVEDCLAEQFESEVWESDDEPPQAAIKEYADQIAGPDLPGIDDGVFPPGITKVMHRSLPKDLAKKFLKEWVGMISSGYAVIEGREEEILKALRERGYVCVEDEELVKKAAGY